MSEYLKDELLEKLSLNKKTEPEIVYEDEDRKVYKDGHYVLNGEHYEH